MVSSVSSLYLAYLGLNPFEFYWTRDTWRFYAHFGTCSLDLSLVLCRWDTWRIPPTPLYLVLFNGRLCLPFGPGTCRSLVLIWKLTPFFTFEVMPSWHMDPSVSLPILSRFRPALSPLLTLTMCRACACLGNHLQSWSLRLCQVDTWHFPLALPHLNFSTVKFVPFSDLGHVEAWHLCGVSILDLIFGVTPMRHVAPSAGL